MKEIIIPALSNTNTLIEVHQRMIEIFQEIKKKGSDRIGYVAGIISSDGENNIQVNATRLRTITDILRQIHNLPLFACTDIFYSNAPRVSELSLPYDERERALNNFWQRILESGHVTDIFMTPRWEISRGAKKEHEIAQKLGLKIYHVDPTQPAISKILLQHPLR